MSTTPLARQDPIRQNYFDQLEIIEKFSDILFYLSISLSIATVLVDDSSNGNLYRMLMIAFVISVFLLFVASQISRLYLAPRAEDKRRQDFFANAYGVGMSHETTVGYYNNEIANPARKMAAQLLENSLFSKSIALRMAFAERLKVVTYAVIWLVALAARETSLGIIAVAAQAVLSEQIISRWLRFEWMRMRYEQTFDCTYQLLQANPRESVFSAQTLDFLGKYETSKAVGAIILSSKIFERENPTLSAEWDRIKQTLHLES